MGRPSKILKKEDIQRAIKMTRSNRAAARYLHVSFTHYKKYAKTYTDIETGTTLFELHKNQAGRTIAILFLTFILVGCAGKPDFDVRKQTPSIPNPAFDLRNRVVFDGK